MNSEDLEDAFPLPRERAEVDVRRILVEEEEGKVRRRESPIWAEVCAESAKAKLPEQAEFFCEGKT